MNPKDTGVNEKSYGEQGYYKSTICRNKMYSDMTRA